MRVALLLPPEDESLQEGLARALVEGLPAHGLKVTAVPWTSRLSFLEVLTHPDEFDLIHNLIGPDVLAYAGWSTRPIVSTTPARMEDDQRQRWLRAPHETWLVRGGPALLDDGMTFLAHIDSPSARSAAIEPSEVAGRYREIYQRVLSAHAAREADTRRDQRPWGEYRVLEDDAHYKVKRIDVFPGKRLSYQRHRRRAEHWLVLQGRAVVTLDGVEHVLGTGQSIDIPLGSAHRVSNPGPQLLSFVEVQIGSYFGEDDIERLEDDFGRAGASPH